MTMTMTNEALWLFKPVDTWVFRDGTPFTAGEVPFSRPRSVFPPSIGALQGAIRTWLATQRGWRPGHDEIWPEELGGPDDSGILSLRGPWLWHEVYGLLFSVPRQVLRHQDTVVSLRPSRDPVWTDLGQVYLPDLAVSVSGARPVENAWITTAGLAAILNGKLPALSHIVPFTKLGQIEPHTGLHQERTTRRSQPGHLYHLEHVRPTSLTALAVQIRGIPSHWTIPTPTIVPLGGEGRMAWLDIQPPFAWIPNCPELSVSDNEVVLFTVTLITPGRWDNLAHVLRHGPVEVPGTVLTACIGPIERMGGWDLKNQRPRSAVPVVPAGSTWFYKAEASALSQIRALHGQCLGQPATLGWGQIVIGRWPQEEGE